MAAQQQRYPAGVVLALVLTLTLACPTWASPPASPRVSPATHRSDPPTLREQLFAQLVSDRARAIDLAFGQTFVPHVTELRVVMLSPDEWEAANRTGVAFYDPEARTLYFARRLQYATPPPTTAGARQYWPWYEEPWRTMYPIVEAVDDALWTTVLTESARARNQTWPHAQCASLDFVERLPCEMLMQGIAAHTTQVKAPMFNENRLAEIWPDDVAELRARAWRKDDSAYQNVRKYGGYLLLRPLVREFGVARTLSYVAGTPFRIEQNNLRVSAEAYQKRAQEALAW
jgi:hypothetical protein